MAPALTTSARQVSEVRFWACFAVVMALVSQALFPVQALAAHMQGTSYAVCNSTTDALADAQSKTTDPAGIMGLLCADCVLASITAIPTPVPVFTAVVYTVHRVDLQPHALAEPAKARAPPRPHSCGPPMDSQA